MNSFLVYSFLNSLLVVARVILTTGTYDSKKALFNLHSNATCYRTVIPVNKMVKCRINFSIVYAIDKKFV